MKNVLNFDFVKFLCSSLLFTIFHFFVFCPLPSQISPRLPDFQVSKASNFQRLQGWKSATSLTRKSETSRLDRVYVCFCDCLHFGCIHLCRIPLTIWKGLCKVDVCVKNNNVTRSSCLFGECVKCDYVVLIAVCYRHE